MSTAMVWAGGDFWFGEAGGGEMDSVFRIGSRQAGYVEISGYAYDGNTYLNMRINESTDGSGHVLFGTDVDLGGLITYAGQGTAEDNALGVSLGTAGVQTTDATETTCGTITTASNRSYAVTCTCLGVLSDNTKSVMFVMSALFRDSGGTLTQVETAVDHFTNTALDDGVTSTNFDIDSSGATIRFRVTGIVAETWEWQTDWKVSVVTA